MRLHRVRIRVRHCGNWTTSRRPRGSIPRPARYQKWGVRVSRAHSLTGEWRTASVCPMPRAHSIYLWPSHVLRRKVNSSGSSSSQGGSVVIPFLNRLGDQKQAENCLITGQRNGVLQDAGVWPESLLK